LDGAQNLVLIASLLASHLLGQPLNSGLKGTSRRNQSEAMVNVAPTTRAADVRLVLTRFSVDRPGRAGAWWPHQVGTWAQVRSRRPDLSGRNEVPSAMLELLKDVPWP
jgi:ABC-type uncharacterized transport system YnjBCD substrate-binding protein